MWRSLFFVMLFLLAPALAEAQQRRAFIVGVQDYAELEKLTRTVEDANGYASVFGKDLGYTVTPLSGAPKRSDFNRAFGAFLESIRPGDEVVFVFSGHGWSDGAENYLALADARKNASEFELKEETVALSRSVLQQIKARNPSVVVAIIDACRDNPFASLTKSGFEKGLVRTETQEGMLVVYAAGERQKALDRLGPTDKASYSVFTRILLPKLRNGARPLMQSLDETREEVERLAGSISHRQRPAVYSDVSLKFCLSGQCAVAAPPPPDAETQAWLGINPGQDRTALCAAYQAHERTYPNGKFVASARALSASLCPQPPAKTETQPSHDPQESYRKGYAAAEAGRYAEARLHYSEACNGGEPKGCTDLGALYDNGQGVPQDYAEARRLYKQGCDGGQPRGCTDLGFLYEKGQGGTQDYSEARRLYKQGCDGGNLFGCTNLGFLYEKGQGVTQDYAEARRLYKQGCDGGNADGCNNLGTLYHNGQGVTQDYAEARRLYTQACDSGEKVACENLKLLPSAGPNIPE